MGQAYRIVNYTTLYERAGQHSKIDKTSGTRRPVRASWIASTNNLMTPRHQRLIRHPQAVELGCAWHYISLVASLMPVRGLLVDEDGHALTPDDLSLMTGFPASIFALAFDVLIAAPFGWLELVEIDAEPLPDTSSHIQTHPDVSRQSQPEPDTSSQVQTNPDASSLQDSTDRTDNYTHCAGEDEPTPNAEAKQAAIAAMEQWSNCNPPVGRGQPLDFCTGEPLRIAALVDDVAQDTPIVRGAQVTPRHLLIPEAVEMLRARGSRFKGIAYACAAVKDALADWARSGIEPGGKARAGPKTGVETQRARIAAMFPRKEAAQ